MGLLKGPVEIVIGTRTGRYTLTNVMTGDEELIGIGRFFDEYRVGDENYSQTFLGFNGILEDRQDGVFVKQEGCLIVPVEDIQVIVIRQVKKEPA